jgi:hypothetical protein
LRDPRIDPQIGDKLHKPDRPGLQRTVEFVSVLGTVVYSTTNKERRTSLTAWRKWARGTVAQLGPDSSLDFPRIMEVALNRQDGRELCRFRSRMLERGIGEGISEPEILVALARLSMALLQHTDMSLCLHERWLETSIKAGR